VPATEPTPSESALLIDAIAVAKLLSISKRHLWRLVDADEFPRPIAIGAKLKRWPRSVVARWIEEQTANASR